MAAHGIPEGAYPAICHYSLVSALDWKHVTATTDETFKLRLPGDDAYFQELSDARVGSEGMRREVTGLADGMPLEPRAMFNFYRTLDIDEDEAQDDLRDSPEVQEADIERGRAFLAHRQFSIQRITDINTIRRIGKNLVRWLRVSPYPTIPKVNRVYLTTPAPAPAGPPAAGAGPPAGGKRRYSRKVRQWGSRKEAASTMRRRSSRLRKQ